MIKIELTPDLEHCIHTLAEKEYEQLSSHVLSMEQASPGTRKRLEILEGVLEGLDLRDLRRQSEIYLAQGKKVTFVFYVKSGLPGYEMHIG